MSELPLKGLRVLDLTIARAGPTAVRHFADWGADVIRIEPPPAGSEEMFGLRDGPDFQNLHRNKRAIQINLKSEQGLAVFYRLVERADILVENMRPAVKHRMKVDYETLRAINPRLIYGSISGFGQSGPYARRAGVDQIIQGMGGLMSVTGAPGGGPMRVGIAVGDLSAGNLLASGILMALYQRERTGEGRWVHTSLLEAQAMMLDFQAARWLVAGEVAGQTGNDHPTGIPCGLFPSSDGLINIAAIGAKLWMRFCETIGRRDWLERPGWQTVKERSLHRQEINQAIAELTRTRPSAYWIELLEDVGIPCGPVYDIAEVFADPQVQHLGIAAPVTIPTRGDVALVGSPLNFEGVEKPAPKPAPPRNADTAAVLEEAGFSPAEIAELKNSGAI